MPVVTTPQPQVTAALGAAMIARRSPEDEALTGLHRDRAGRRRRGRCR